MEILPGDDARPRVMVIHRNGRVARFFDGVLRGCCQVELFRDCATAMKRIRSQAPDLILCELASVIAADAGPFRAFVTTLDVLDPPIVLISADRFEEHTVVVHLKLPVLDCISQSINPQLLNWKVKNVLSLKQIFDRFRKSRSTFHEKSLQPETSIAWIEENVPYKPQPMAKLVAGLRKAGLE